MQRRNQLDTPEHETSNRLSDMDGETHVIAFVKPANKILQSFRTNGSSFHGGWPVIRRLIGQLTACEKQLGWVTGSSGGLGCNPSPWEKKLGWTLSERPQATYRHVNTNRCRRMACTPL